jgi:hypothetical protein
MIASCGTSQSNFNASTSKWSAAGESPNTASRIAAREA